MAQASQFWRTRPAVLSVTGIAVVFGVIAVYSAFAKQSSTSGLRRSNAVHRPRRERHLPTVYCIRATPDAPLGTIVIRRGEEAWEFDLATTPLPSANELHQLVPQANEQNHTELVDGALDLVLSSCFIAAYQAHPWASMQEQRLGDLTTAMASRDENQIRLHASDVRSVLRLDGISNDQIDRAVVKFLGSETWLGNLELSAEDDGGDPAETEEVDLLDSAGREPSQGLRGLLYYIAEEDAKRKAYEHRGIHCEECGESPIRGVRWHCINCPDFDLCASCEPHTEHPKTHVFAKIKIPLPVLSQPTKEYKLWYPGDPRKIHAALDSEFRTRLCGDHEFEEPQIDALYDQFTCLANVQWHEDTSAIKAAIDKRAFNKALTCEKWSSLATSNVLYDRMFSFYDTDGNGLIGFEEFISGFAYLRGPKRFAFLHRAIKGYDMNGDGFVDRADFLRLLRAKFTIQQQLVRDSIEGQETEQTLSALDILRSSQPISSIFAQEDIPLGESRPRRDKQLDDFGDMRPLHETKAILEDDDPWPRANRKFMYKGLPTHERLRHNLSRFEELLNGTTSEQELGIIDHQIDGFSPLFVPEGHDGASPEGDMLIDPLNSDGEDDELAEPHIQDILWQATEDGLQSLLDALFLSKEQLDQEAINTRDERSKWRQEFEAVEEEDRQFQNRLEESNPFTVVAWQHSPTAQPTITPFTSDIVPTDWESLERREQDIADTSLEELLNATGYGLRSGHEAGGHDTSPRLALDEPPSRSDISTQGASPSPPHRTVASSNNVDIPVVVGAAMPRNASGGDASASKYPGIRQTRRISEGLSTVERSPEHPPSRRRLQYLYQMEQVDRHMQDRGGPGKLTYAEVEAITVNTGGELRGLIRSWLEWASF